MAGLYAKCCGAEWERRVSRFEAGDTDRKELIVASSERSPGSLAGLKADRYNTWEIKEMATQL